MTSSRLSSALTRPRYTWASSSASAQPERRAPADHVDLVSDPAADELVDREGAGYAVDQRQHVGREVGLQLGVLEQVVEHHPRDRVALEHDDQPLAGATRGVVSDAATPWTGPESASSAIFSAKLSG